MRASCDVQHYAAWSVLCCLSHCCKSGGLLLHRQVARCSPHCCAICLYAVLSRRLFLHGSAVRTQRSCHDLAAPPAQHSLAWHSTSWLPQSQDPRLHARNTMMAHRNGRARLLLRLRCLLLPGSWRMVSCPLCFSTCCSLVTVSLSCAKCTSLHYVDSYGAAACALRTVATCARQNMRHVTASQSAAGVQRRRPNTHAAV
jgi:hypothetical protein